MSDSESNDIFENHINSEQFDMSSLHDTPAPVEPIPSDESVTPVLDEAATIPLDRETLIQQQIDRVMNRLADTDDTTVWEDALDSRQQQLCLLLVNTIIETMMRTDYGDEFDHLTDDELTQMLYRPVALTLLAQQEVNPPRLSWGKRAPWTSEPDTEDNDIATSPSRFKASRQFKVYRMNNEQSAMVKDILEAHQRYTRARKLREAEAKMHPIQRWIHRTSRWLNQQMNQWNKRKRRPQDKS